MPRTRILAVCVVVVASCALCVPAKAQQQPANANAPGPAVPTVTPDQRRSAPSAQNPAPPAAGTETPPPPGAPSDPQKQCVKPGEFAVELRSGRNPVGAPIVLATNFLPTNQRVDVGVRAPFVDGMRYFAGIDYGDETYR
jgi:hypothetical protein